MSEADDLLRQFKELVGDTFGAVDGPDAKQRARLAMVLAPAASQALRDEGLFLVTEGEGVVNGKVVKLRFPAPKDAEAR